MEEKEFVSVVLARDILAKEEMTCLMQNFNGVLTGAVGFPEDRRIGPVHACCRFECLWSADEDGGWNYDFTGHFAQSSDIEFSVDKDIMLHGIRLFGSKGNDYDVYLDIIDCQTNNSLIKVEDNFLSVPFPYKGEKIYVLDVLLDPCLLTRNNRYVVQAFLIGKNSCFGNGGIESVQCHGVRFAFRTAKKEKPVTTDVEFGQFAEFLFKPVG